VTGHPQGRLKNIYHAKQKCPLFDYCGFDQPERSTTTMYVACIDIKSQLFFFLEICLLRATAAAGTQCCSVHWEMYSNVEEINTLMLKVSVLNYWT